MTKINRRCWESWEILFVQLSHKDTKKEEIAKYLNRTVNSIQGIIQSNFKDPNKIKIGKKYNNLTVLEYAGPSPGVVKRKRWKCLCDCGNINIVSTLNLINGSVKGCKNCSNPPIGKIGFPHFSNIRTQAKQRKKEFKITHKYIAELFDLQNGICPLTGIKLTTDISKNYWRGTASLDRIDSKKGYIEGNVQWTHKDINKMKWKFNNKEFIDLCKQIVNYSQQEYDDKTNDWW